MVKTRKHPPRGKHGNVKLVLVEDVQFLGKQGDLVEVRPGYSRNYLLPRGLGMVPTEHNLRLLDRYKIKVRQARDARLADLKALGEQISKMPGITIEANVVEGSHTLYGSVGEAEIAKGLRGKNLPVDPEMVRMEGGHIKETGLFEVPLNLGFDIETKVKVLVIAQQK
ncbi:MAG: 50S ribosomal protein L9 [Planctomycetia bacterium]|nr:50S ribosomal protein L9 [Planctomycetia bacterium]